MTAIKKDAIKIILISFFFVGIIFLCIALWGASYTHKMLKEETDIYGEATTFWTAYNKNPPQFQINTNNDIFASHNLNVTVHTNEKYKEVSFKMCIYDSQGAIIQQQIYTEKLLDENNTYKFTYNIFENMTLDQIAEAEQVKLVMYSYK